MLASPCRNCEGMSYFLLWNGAGHIFQMNFREEDSFFGCNLEEVFFLFGEHFIEVLKCRGKNNILCILFFDFDKMYILISWYNRPRHYRENIRRTTTVANDFCCANPCSGHFWPQRDFANFEAWSGWKKFAFRLNDLFWDNSRAVGRLNGRFWAKSEWYLSENFHF